MANWMEVLQNLEFLALFVAMKIPNSWNFGYSLWTNMHCVETKNIPVIACTTPDSLSLIFLAWRESRIFYCFLLSDSQKFWFDFFQFRHPKMLKLLIFLAVAPNGVCFFTDGGGVVLNVPSNSMFLDRTEISKPWSLQKLKFAVLDEV